MHVPKAKNKTVQSHRLSSLDGVRELKIGRASVEARQRGNAHVTGQNAVVDNSDFADVKAFHDRLGPFGL